MISTSVLVAALLAVDAGVYYSPSNRQQIPANIYYQAPKIEKQEEEDEVDEIKPETDPTRVIVYIDLSDTVALRKLLGECDRLPGLKIEYQDKSRAPASAGKFKYPVVHYHTNAGWRVDSWRGPDQFRKDWIAGNTDGNGKLPVPVSKLQVPAVSPSTNARYVAYSHEWHITQGESASALRSHLSSAIPEHHGHSFPRWFLDRLSFYELVGVHSDFHNNRPRYEFVRAAQTQTARQADPQRSTQRSQTGVAAFFDFLKSSRRRSRDNCPDGNCPR